MKILTVKSILNAAYLSVSHNKLFFALLTTAFLLVNLLLRLLLEGRLIDSGWWSFSVMITSFLILAKLTIMIHRSILLKECGFQSMFDWSFKEVKFILVSCLIGFLSFGLSGFLLYVVMAIFMNSLNNLLITFIGVAFFTIGGAIFSRLSLILPAIAIQNDIGLDIVWRESENHVMSLFVLMIGVPLLVMVVAYAVFSLFLDSVWIMRIIQWLQIVVTVYEVAILTHCYDTLFVEPEVEKALTV